MTTGAQIHLRPFCFNACGILVISTDSVLRTDCASWRLVLLGETKTLKVNAMTEVKINNVKGKLDEVKVGMQAYIGLSLDRAVASQVFAKDAGAGGGAGATAAGSKVGKGGKRVVDRTVVALSRVAVGAFWRKINQGSPNCHCCFVPDS